MSPLSPGEVTQIDCTLYYVFIWCNLGQSHLYHQQICLFAYEQMQITNWLVEVAVIGSCILKMPRLHFTCYVRNDIAA